jgi:hypothetical protein
LPSEFGTDPARMPNALEPGRVTFDDKMVVRKAIQDAKIPFTYVSANCFAGYFLGGLCQPGYILPSRDSVVLFGDGNTKGTVLPSKPLKVSVELFQKEKFKPTRMIAALHPTASQYGHNTHSYGVRPTH